jgi:hypothetical protein
MADPLTFALTQPELAARLVQLQRERALMPSPESDHAYIEFFDTVPLASRADAHEFAILTRVPVVWTQEDVVDPVPYNADAPVQPPGFVRCWLEGNEGWRILGASGPVQSQLSGRFEVRLDVAAPNAAHGFPVMVVVEQSLETEALGGVDLPGVAAASAKYLQQHGLLQEEIPRTFLMALFLYLSPQLEQVINWFRRPAQNLHFGAPREIRAFKSVGLDVLDYPVAPA